MARKHGIAWYAGAESDLISRYLGVAREFRADGIIRVTGDNALMDPVVVDRVAAKLVEGGYDFAGNSFHPTYPHGMEAEAFSLEYLERLDSLVGAPYWREWFTSYTKEHPHQFAIGAVTRFPSLAAERWTIDYLEDYQLVRKVYEALYCSGKYFTMEDIFCFLNTHPEIRGLNRKYQTSSMG